ncbi:hypothetical protein [Pseudorhodoferax sp.]|uniref:hypothetical protein n=1 Tax=Pseudorhodoferax sp. TaxID=1993553 RepID=UPI0039E6863F
MNLVEALIQPAIATLRRHAREEPLSLFIDPTLVDPIVLLCDSVDLDASAQAWVKKNIIRLPFIHNDFDPERQPYILHLPNESSAERIVNEALRFAIEESLSLRQESPGARSVCGVIVGDDNPFQTARRLAQLARIKPQEQQPWYLRYWDPRVIWHLPRILPASLWEEISNNIGSWLTIGPQRQLQLFTPDSKKEIEPLRTPLQIQNQIWDRLSLIGPTNQVLTIGEDFGIDPTPTQAQRIEKLLTRAAQTWGLAADGDGIVFAVAGLTSHDRFDEHPLVAAALQAAARENKSIGTVLADFDDTFWAEVSNGRWAQPAQHNNEMRTRKKVAP